MLTRWKTEDYVTTWTQFNSQLRPKGNLLKRLDEFPNSILVTGCQRSGTTMLTRVLTQSEGLTNYWFGPDDELDSALILSGYVEHSPQGRYCFQTTFVNRRYYEYFEHQNGHKIIWVLRNPYSVVYSMLYNWGNYSLNAIFGYCGVPSLSGIDARLYSLFGARGVSNLNKACWAYQGKMVQLFDLIENLDPDKIMVIDYDDLAAQKTTILPAIYNFVNLPYKKSYEERIHSKSLSKADRFSNKEKATISSMCEPIYQKARSLITKIEPEIP